MNLRSLTPLIFLLAAGCAASPSDADDTTPGSDGRTQPGGSSDPSPTPVPGDPAGVSPAPSTTPPPMFTPPTPEAGSETPEGETPDPGPTPEVTLDSPTPYVEAGTPDPMEPTPGLESETPAPSSPPPGPGEDTPAPPPGTPTPAPAPEVLHFEAQPDGVLAWQFQVELSRPAPLRIVCTSPDDYQEYLILRQAPDTVFAVTVRGFEPDTAYQCSVALDDNGAYVGRSEFVTDPLPPDLPAPVITRLETDPSDIGYTLYNFSTLSEDFQYEAPYLVLLDAEGNIRWYLAGAGGGTVDATFLGDDLILFGGQSGSCTFPPTIVGLDGEQRFVATSEPATSSEIAGSYHHDMGLSEDGGSIFTLVHTRVWNTFMGFTIKEIDLDNNIVWYWDATLDGFAQGALEPGSEENYDPYHANSLFDRWENGRLYLYLSLRNMNQVLKIDYETKEVLWKLGVGGNFGLLEADGSPAEQSRWFFDQHDVKPEGNLLVIHDNGTNRQAYGEPDYSRALVLEVDEAARSARIRFEYTEPGWVEPIWGGLDLLSNDHYLVAMAHCWPCDTAGEGRTTTLLDIDGAGRQLWRAEFEDPHVVIYRADRIDGCKLFHNARYCPELE